MSNLRSNVKRGDWPRVRQALQKLKSELGPGAVPIHSGLTLSDLTASRLVASNADKLLISSDLAAWVTGTANEIDITDDGDGTITVGIVNPLIVAKGGTGIAALTDHGILLGSGTDAVTPLGVAGNGYIPIGSAAADPVLALITGTANQITSTPGAGSITLSTPQDIHAAATPTFAGLISTGVVRATDFAKTGWPITPGVTLSFVGGTTRTLTVTDDDSAYYYIDGVKYVLGENKTVQIDDLEGLWYIYFDGATLTASQSIWSFRAEDKALVAYIYWARDVGTPANGKAIFVGYELHSFHMDGSTHARLHYAGGARWEVGLLVSDAGSGTVDVSAGDMWDEDLNIAISDEGGGLFSQVLSPAQLPIYYRDGASAWRVYETSDKAAVTDVGYLSSGLLKWNDATTTWSNETVGGNNYVAYYVVATNEQTEPVVLIMGQRVDNKLSDAKINNVFAGLSLTGLPFQEMTVLARLILKDDATYSLEEVLDLRAYNIKGNITSPLITQHAGLGGLDFASSGHSGFQAWDAQLDDIAALAVTNGNIIVGDGANWVAESGATARTSLGLGTGDSPTFTGLTVGDTVITDGVITDATGLSIAAHASFTGYLSLVTTTTNSTGVIRKGADAFLHDFHHPTGDTAVPDGYNLFIGVDAGNFTMGDAAVATQDGSYNCGIGRQSLHSNTLGFANSAIGPTALYSNTSGGGNNAFGYEALYSNTTGNQNIAIGHTALYTNVGGHYNIAFGFEALYSNISGGQNNAIGFQSSKFNTTGVQNIAFGYKALYTNTIGSNNLAIGYQTLRDLNPTDETEGKNNTVCGAESGGRLSTASACTFFGYGAGYRQTTNDNLFIIDNQIRASAAAESTNAILYGVMAAAPANQTLNINARIVATSMKSGINQGASGAGAGELWVDTDDDNTVKRGT